MVAVIYPAYDGVKPEVLGFQVGTNLAKRSANSCTLAYAWIESGGSGSLRPSLWRRISKLPPPGKPAFHVEQGA